MFLPLSLLTFSQLVFSLIMCILNFDRLCRRVSARWASPRGILCYSWRIAIAFQTCACMYLHSDFIICKCFQPQLLKSSFNELDPLHTWLIVTREIFLASQNANMRLYGGAQYHRAMAEFRLIVGKLKCQTISREEIVNACGVEDIHDGTNYVRLTISIYVLFSCSPEWRSLNFVI